MKKTECKCGGRYRMCGYTKTEGYEYSCNKCSQKAFIKYISKK